MASVEENVELKAHCLCTANTFTCEVPRSTLPLPAHACHCNSCRHVTGAMYTIDTVWPVPASKVDTSKLKRYKFSERMGILFCQICSTPVFFPHLRDDKEVLEVFLGALEDTPVDLIQIKTHLYLDDAIDGGASMWLRKPNADESEANRFRTRESELPFDWPANSAFTGYKQILPDPIPIHCKCKGVDFMLHRANYQGKKEEELPWFIDPQTHKALASICTCDSCRLSAGIDTFNWTFSEIPMITFGDGKTLDDTSALRALVDARHPSIGTLAYYSSSSDAQRYFCSNCSACVFYATDDRSWMINIAVGVLAASDGARAEGFLSWSFGHVGYGENTKGGWRENLKNHVERESEQWRIDRGYPKCWRRVKREEAERKVLEAH